MLEGLHAAVGCGATFLDTSDSYGCGRSERVIGRFLREYPDTNLHLSSKVGRIRGSAPHPYAGRHIHHQLEQSLENLYAEHLDLYTLESFDFGPGDRYLGTAIEMLRALRDVGSIRAIGLRGPYAAYDASPAEWAAQAERFHFLFRLVRPDVVWTRFNAFTPCPLLDGEDLFSFTARRGTGLVLSAPLAHGALTGQLADAPLGRMGQHARAGLTPLVLELVENGLRALRRHFGTAEGTLARVALRSALQRGDHCVVVAGFGSAEQVAENYGCLGAPLTDEELAVVDEVYAGLRAGLQKLFEGRPVQAVRV
ncbi:aldo/keto reductase [Streptomyces uncialis]|uniref:aldo/keto reductase n=1 Tax=Streptomyces uncialis TaxID=1048205 RepID=UPI0033DB7FF3